MSLLKSARNSFNTRKKTLCASRSQRYFLAEVKLKLYKFKWAKSSTALRPGKRPKEIVVTKKYPPDTFTHVNSVLTTGNPTVFFLIIQFPKSGTFAQLRDPFFTLLHFKARSYNTETTAHWTKFFQLVKTQTSAPRQSLQRTPYYKHCAN